jgi:hypothetical protein
MGRRPIGERAMSAAERQRRRRAKGKAFRDTDPVTKSATAFRDEERVTKPAAAFRDTEQVTKLERELALARDEIEALRRENELLRRALLVFPANPDKGTLRPDTVKLILRCLHPDNSASEQMRHEAFIAFKQIADRQEGMRRYEEKQRQQAERRAAREAKRKAARDYPIS